MFADILVKKCFSILFYGMDCCILNGVVLRSLSQAWNMSFKWLFNLRKYDSTRLLFLSCNTMSMKYLLDGKIMKFYRLLGGTNVSLINNLMLLNYDKHYMLFNE